MARVDGSPVCVVTLTYVKPLADVDALMAAHVVWLEQGFADGRLLLAGRQVPRTGGLVVCRGGKADVTAFAATDPFVAAGVAQTAVVEIAASFAHDALAAALT
jgi:uncharacterized protein YciI